MKRLVIVLALTLLVGCSGQQDVPGAKIMDEATQERWEIALVEMRIEKNEEFVDRTQSPLPEAAIASFEGLNYYFPDQQFVFELPLQAAATVDTVFLTKRRGEEVPYLRKGTVAFSHDGSVHTLQVFGSADGNADDYLWLPFYDATNGTETYGGGRYLDLELGQAGTVVVDFNYAYNPLCDYNHERYNCALPPEGNRLPFAVSVGEKIYGQDN